MIGYLAMVAASWGSIIVAIVNPFWLVDSRYLNAGAFLRSPNETVFFRRVLVLEVRTTEAYGPHALSLGLICVS